MVQITELGYIGLSISDAAAWKTYATEVVGLEWLDEGEADRFYLRLDEWHHRITLHVDGQDDLAYLGLRVAGGAELQEMAQQLRQCDVSYRIATEAECRERHVLGMLKLKDPSGNPLEIFHGPRVDAHKPFYPGRRMYGKFVTGTGGLGHLIVRSDDFAASERFYSRALGMRGTIEYHQPLPNGQVLKPYFMHCNDRDHTLAFGMASMKKRINHLMLEVAEVDDVGMTYETVQQRKVPIAITLGKHSNDRMVSFYMLNPSGWMIEYGSGGRAALHQTEYYVKDVWGHDFILPLDGVA